VFRQSHGITDSLGGLDYCCGIALPSIRQHLMYGDVRRIRGKILWNVLCCIYFTSICTL